ncbi:MAG: nucleotidyl transferase AbiEii/AbiGii toxin family protein [Verrucomicrobia bacterium]|nr:nucleotidyl transferase AbiEii/AbiGii toxin family protein [Verrucomicrobiota bacterium]MDA1068992.1 nucleotidyl transferase AbiEii/AbiGii toxin family protein [Verrucomicrobiota bacterium]
MLRYEAIQPEALDLLRALAPLPAFEDFALVGGTSLALQLGHRLSVDLDFFTPNDFSTDHVLEVLEPHFDLVVTGRAAYSLNCLINGIKVDILRHRYVLLKDLVVEGGIKLWSIEDIAAAKISAITNRGAKKDFYDLVAILSVMPLDSVLSCFEKKYPSGERFMAMKSLSWFEDAESEPDPITLAELNWEEVKETVLESLKKIPS